jgi:hypothetical protein
MMGASGLSSSQMTVYWRQAPPLRPPHELGLTAAMSVDSRSTQDRGLGRVILAYYVCMHVNEVCPALLTPVLMVFAHQTSHSNRPDWVGKRGAALHASSLGG